MENQMNPKSLVENLNQLVSLPDVCIKVNQLLGSPDYSVSHIADIIIQDADISARLLRLVNSPLYGQHIKVETVSRAITLLGANELRNLIMATAAQSTFADIPDELVNMEEFWRHSVTTGVMSQSLAKHCNTLHSERLFVMGMLHDIGRLVMYLTIPKKARDILLITGGDNWILAEVEQEILGFTHLDVGAELMRAWQLPDSFIEIAGLHNNPQMAKNFPLEASLVHIAKAIANGQIVGLSVDEMIWAINPFAWETTSISANEVTAMVDDMQAKSDETMSLILAPAKYMHA
jgi:putative nucleotidyltransferase with HDIG domain